MITTITDLQSLPNWVSFDVQPQPAGKARKLPFIPGTDRLAKTNDPTTWCAHAEAMADATRTDRSPGVAITPEMGLTLIDIDGVIDHPLIDALDSYTEQSLNGGLHILVRGRPPVGFVAPAGVEIYPRSGNRFLLLTGDVIDGRDTIEARSDVLAELFPPRPEPRHIAPAPALGEPDDAEAIARVRRMSKGRQLFDTGDITGYPSGSEADVGLLNSFILAGVTDPTRLDRLYRQSALARERNHWHQRGYRERTLAFALNGVVGPFEGWDRAKNGVVVGNPQDAEYPAGAITEPLAATDPQSLRIASDPCTQRVAELERQLAEAKATIAAQAATIDALKRVQSSERRILGNRTLGAPRVVAAALATQFAWRATAGETPPSEAGDAPPPGMMKVSVEEIAKAAGISTKSAGTHLATLAEHGLIARKLKTTTETVNQTTGEIYAAPVYVTAQYVGPTNVATLTPEAAVAFADTVASFTTERIERRGGKRTPRCPDHPDAGVVREHIDRCAECRRELDRDEAPLPTVALEPLPRERSAKFADHTGVAGDVLLRRKSSDRSEGAGERSANFADRERRDRAAVDLADREPSWLRDAPDPWDSVPQPALFVPPDPPQSHHFDVGD